MAYQNPPSIDNDEDETAVPIGTTILPSTTMTMTMTTTRGHRSLQWRMIAIVAGMLMIVVAGGATLMLRTTDGGRTTTAVESVVVATETFADPTMIEIVCKERCAHLSIPHNCERRCERD